jgi:hypothetical protein
LAASSTMTSSGSASAASSPTTCLLLVINRCHLCVDCPQSSTCRDRELAGRQAGVHGRRDLSKVKCRYVSSCGAFMTSGHVGGHGFQPRGLAGERPLFWQTLGSPKEVRSCACNLLKAWAARSLPPSPSTTRRPCSISRPARPPSVEASRPISPCKLPKYRLRSFTKSSDSIDLREPNTSGLGRGGSTGPPFTPQSDVILQPKHLPA